MVHSKVDDSDLLGETIDNGTLLLLEILGSGAYGVVYRAEDLTSLDGEQFAVKCIRKPSSGEDAFDFRTTELALHGKVSGHPSIVTMHRSFEDEEHLFIVFELCPGGDLFGFITTRGIYFRNDELVKQAFTQLIDAMDHCHQNNVFHRDLKPENILCSKDGSHLWLADFGLATDKSVSNEFRCGSSYYMSPECLRRDLRLKEFQSDLSDVWALGIILVNMITNRNPWRCAVIQDGCFAGYLEDQLYLRDVLPISKEANKLFRRIFTLTPRSRISLSQLREAVQDIETFFMSDSELQRASDIVRDCAISYANQGTGQYVPIASEADSSESSGSSSTCSTCSSSCCNSGGSDDIRALVCSEPKTSSAADLPRPVNPHPSSTAGDVPAQLTPLLKSCDPVSSAESVGPITPETHPIHPVTEVPPLADVDGLCEVTFLPYLFPLDIDPVPKAPRVAVENLEPVI